MCPLFKKGDRREKGNYREIVLLAMGSRVCESVREKDEMVGVTIELDG